MYSIAETDFRTRFVALVLGSGGSLPKKPLDRHILYLSAIPEMVSDRNYSESELNALLVRWVQSFGDSFGLDHVSLRRYLVDEGYLKRDHAGRYYELASDPPYSIQPSVAALDLAALVDDERAAREERKTRYTAG